VSHQQTAVAALVGLFLAGVVFVLAGPDRLTALLLAALPFLVLVIDLTPALTLTVTAGCTALLLLLLTPLRSDVKGLPWLAVWLFALLVLAQAASDPRSAQLTEALKYALFPAMALVVSSETSRARLSAMRPLLLASGVAAMAIDGLAIVLHFGSVGGYYHVGEQLGLAGESPHEIALIGVMVAVACLVTVRDVRLRLLGAAIAATPALATGVRSALVALALSLLVLAVRARFRPSVVLGIAAILAAIIFSGVGTIIVARYQQSEATGEFSSVATAGSGRGSVWTTALHAWETSGPARFVFGSGLRSVETIEERDLGEVVTAQSDAVAVLVELGLVGLLALLLLWLVIVRSAVNWLVLLPLASYGLTNGALEYVGAVVFGIALAAACGRGMPTRPADPVIT
jgi:hypothetical protein